MDTHLEREGGAGSSARLGGLVMEKAGRPVCVFLHPNHRDIGECLAVMELKSRCQ